MKDRCPKQTTCTISTWRFWGRKVDPMATKFRSVLEKLPKERQARIRERTTELLAELPLRELRQARELSQEELAEVLGLNQATISKLERRTDMYLSSLRRFVEAMGGELEITANFPDGSVKIQLLEDLADDEADSA
jgi:DNA-binding XRE family transcriptional regulator